MKQWAKAMLIVFGHITLAIASIAGLILVENAYPTHLSWVIITVMVIFPYLIGLFAWVSEVKVSLDRQQNGKTHE
jgi:hypothetical protein